MQGLLEETELTKLYELMMRILAFVDAFLSEFASKNAKSKNTKIGGISTATCTMSEMIEFLTVVDSKVDIALTLLRPCLTFSALRSAVVSSPANRDLDPVALERGTKAYTKELSCAYCPDYWKKV